MSQSTIDNIIALWAQLNPVAGYTSGYDKTLTTLPHQTKQFTDTMINNIDNLDTEANTIEDDTLRITAKAVLLSLKTQLKLARPSGAGPSGTGMGGVWGAADGVFYIVLKKESDKKFVPDYLDAVNEMIVFETEKWSGQFTTVEVKRECLNTADYMTGCLESLSKAIVDCPPDFKKKINDKINVIDASLDSYRSAFLIPGLDSNTFSTYWPIFQKGDQEVGPQAAMGYPACLKGYYQLTQTMDELDKSALAWLELDLPDTIHMAQRIAQLMEIEAPYTLASIWSAVSEHFSLQNVASRILHKKIDPNDPTIFDEVMAKVEDACNNFGAEKIIGHTKDDVVLFDPTPDYLVNLVTGGEDFAINYLNKATAYSQLYLTSAKNSSLLTMINILVHEASHGYNFVLAAKNAAPLYNLNTALEVPTTEGQAFYREYQYWAAAQNLLDLDQDSLTDVDKEYLSLYGETKDDQEFGVLCAQLETYIWRIIRYIRQLCDARVNGGTMTYTDFIKWASVKTGLSEEMLHGECFTFLAAPGYAPCYATGCAVYSNYQKRGILNGVTELDFNTKTSQAGFFAWPLNEKLMDELANKQAVQMECANSAK